MIRLPVFFIVLCAMVEFSAFVRHPTVWTAIGLVACGYLLARSQAHER